MARGGGLSIDSDPAASSFFLSNPIVLSSFPVEDDLQPPMDSSFSFPAEMDFFSNNNLKPSSSSSTDDDSSTPPHPLDFRVNTGLNLLTMTDDQSVVGDAFAIYPPAKSSEVRSLKTEIAILQAELEEIMGENHKLKEKLNKVSTDYNALKMHIDFLVSRKGGEDAEKPENPVPDASPEEKKQIESNRSGTLVPRQFIDLGLASINEGDQANSDEPWLSSSVRRSNNDRSESPIEVECSAKIGSDKKEFNKETDIEEEADKINNQNYSPPKNVDDQVEATMRKARVSVRARSEAPMITDGCQWRKYGQKMAKGNPCPRAYYRCTMASGCPVKKQVQRCAEDRTILVTTYEGSHNHALPPAAMAMAQTTAAAVRTSLLGSMSSNDGLMNASFLTGTTLLPCSSSNMATLSASAPFPTVTLDLTIPPTTQQPSTSFQMPFSSNAPNGFTQVLAQALCSNNKSNFSGLQMNNKDPLQLSAAVTADHKFTAALTAAITSIMGSALSNNINGDKNGKVISNNNNDSNFSKN